MQFTGLNQRHLQPQVLRRRQKLGITRRTLHRKINEMKLARNAEETGKSYPASVMPVLEMSFLRPLTRIIAPASDEVPESDAAWGSEQVSA